MTDKTTIRKEIIFQRNQLTLPYVCKKSFSIFYKVTTLLEDKHFQNIMLYLPINNEVDTNYYFAHYLNQQKNVYLPTIKGNEIIPIQYKKDSLLEEGSFGTLQPVHDKDLTLTGSSLQVCIIPCVACDKQKNRLGYGKGFYDRFLKQTNAIKIGLCFNFQLVESLPIEVNDVVMDYIVTDETIIS